MVAVWVEDLLFRSKFSSSLGAGVRFPSDADGAALSPGDVAVVDLGLSCQDPVALVGRLRQQHPSLTIIGFCAHVERELKRRAEEAGASEVLAHSELVQRLAEWVGA